MYDILDINMAPNKQIDHLFLYENDLENYYII
jgi:hypothetical protein